MEYDDDYEIAMRTILQIIDKEGIPELSTDSKDLSERIYKDITDGINYARKNVTADKFKIATGIKMIQPFHNYIMSNKIHNNIKNSMVKQIEFNYDFFGRIIRLTIGIMNDNPISDEEVLMSFRRMVSWLFVCNKYSTMEHCRTLIVDVYFTGIKKGFPNSDTIPIDHTNINSGVSNGDSDSNILIFRYEEWFKVFIHECGHSYGFESHGSIGQTLSSFVNSQISIKVRPRIGEAYVETWARIVMVFYSSIANSINHDDFLSLLRFNMKVESIFSAIQAYRILAFMKIPYNVVIDPLSSEGTSYKESTNVFAYYILCGSFMQDPFKFINLCDNHNTKLLQINKDSHTIHAYEKYISESLRNSAYEKLMSNFQHLANRRTGLRFTITELPKN